MSYIHNDFGAYVLTAQMGGVSDGYEFRFVDMFIKFLDEYGFDKQHYCVLRDDVKDIIRLNAVFPTSPAVSKREIKQICKQLEKAFDIFIKGDINKYIVHDAEYHILWGETTIKTGDFKYNEDY